ncbi:unnamed protein product [Toxocara canis]|uniref:Secreted protein n=1 Tax=Toxocara canis TaxID=6265 RepID=A0A183UEV9_TOXCA|nr:unnamed protein product [Toxocara canis]
MNSQISSGFSAHSSYGFSALSSLFVCCLPSTTVLVQTHLRVHALCPHYGGQQMITVIFSLQLASSFRQSMGYYYYGEKRRCHERAHQREPRTEEDARMLAPDWASVHCACSAHPTMHVCHETVLKCLHSS